MTSILDINEVTRFLIKHPNWSIDQLFFCLMHIYDDNHCRANGRTKIERPISLMYAYFDSRGIDAFDVDEIHWLVEEGYVEQIGNKIKIDMVRVTRKFHKEFFGLIDFDELYRLYPSFMDNWNHPSQPDIKLKAGNKERLERQYLSTIKTEASHNRVMEITEWAKSNNELNMTIQTYIESEMWNQLEKKMLTIDNSYADI